MQTRNMTQGETTWHETPRDVHTQAAIYRAHHLNRSDDRTETQVIEVREHRGVPDDEVRAFFVEYVRGRATAHPIADEG